MVLNDKFDMCMSFYAIDDVHDDV